ncbi:tRNA (adenosine(37)-N6)-threonylcarbamoyltransferase complex dimerization subunit type 1 TsaB [Chloroflexota bacterium]
MKILSIDTSGYANAVAVIDGDQVLADVIFEARNDSLQKIIANIDSALSIANLTLRDIQGLGVGLGPGSWTGIRVGVTVGKLLAYSIGKPVAGVSTLEVLAFAGRENRSLICPIINTGARDTVYAAFYRSNDGIVTRTGEVYVGDLQGLSAMLKEPTLLIGAEASLYRTLINQASGSPHASIEAVDTLPRGASVALLAAYRLERGESDDALSLAPLYLKESTARAFRNKYLGSAWVKGKD